VARTEALSPAVEAYIWGFPLVSVHRTRLLLCSRHNPGTLNHLDELSTPSDRAIVAPNNDTLYSSGWYDLRYGDLTIDVPPMDKPGRYWNVMIADAYTHVTYIARRHHGTGGTQVKVTFDPSAPPGDDDSSTVTVGTPTAWVIIRVLVESPADIDVARQLQRAIVVTAPSSHPSSRTERAGRATDIASSGVDVFDEIRRYMAIDPPASWHPPLSNAAQAIIDDPSSFSSEELLKGIAEADKLITRGNAEGTVIENGWSTGRAAGGPGDNILKRATGAKFGLGGHYAIENRSYVAVHDADGNKLDGRQPLQMRFAADALPPCNAFWSLTAYGTDLYLVENEIDRWSISDRTPDLKYAEDGSLTLVLSAERPPDTANWLPVPDGPFMLGMRVYEGLPDVVNCQWFPPPLTAPERT
jgi:hypothetical protein